MASNVPVIKEASWISLIPQIIVVALLVYLYYLLNFGEPYILGPLTFYIITFALRYFIANHHRKGIALVKQQKFAEAIPYFEKSYDWFTKNSWVDKFRFLTMLSSSKMCYREMALCNIAFCYSQTGNGQKAIEYYQQTLKAYPANGLAQAGVKMLGSMDNKTHPTA